VMSPLRKTTWEPADGYFWVLIMGRTTNPIPSDWFRASSLGRDPGIWSERDGGGGGRLEEVRSPIGVGCRGRRRIDHIVPQAQGRNRLGLNDQPTSEEDEHDKGQHQRIKTEAGDDTERNGTDRVPMDFGVRSNGIHEGQPR
jgi:hypothetical protein